jgi:glycosyltransferase involved in cell wall biosynthesis
MVCVPSRNEPFGIIILEAWNVGKPVVATDAASIIKNFEDGLLAYIQPESLAWCIDRLLDNPKEMEKLAKTGKARTEAEFDWVTIAKDTEATYNSIQTSTK